MRHQCSVQRASGLERPVVSGWERSYQRGRMRSLWDAAGRDDGGWRPPSPTPGKAQARSASNGQRLLTKRCTAPPISSTVTPGTSQCPPPLIQTATAWPEWHPQAHVQGVLVNGDDFSLGSRLESDANVVSRTKMSLLRVVMTFVCDSFGRTSLIATVGSAKSHVTVGL